MRSIEISIVIPAYNEETNIRLGALEKVVRYLESQTFSWEVIIVDDGSTDMTKSLLSEFVKANKGFEVLYNPHLGKAGTVISGMLKAKGNIVLFTDLDQATPLSQMQKLLPFFKKGFDVVIGSRSRQRQGAPMLRRIMARGFMILRSTFLGLHGIVDTQCGFKAFRRQVAQDVFHKLQRYGNQKETSGSMVTAGFDIEVLFVAKRLGFSIAEVPVEWHYVETRRVNPVRDSIYGVLDILAIRIHAMRGKY
jgi:glycosyltransferase involved in cell wall biosynthesis